MSFLDEGEASGTLQDVLAFVDDWERDTLSRASASPCLLPPKPLASPRFSASQIKDELLYLRNQAETLERRLQQLQSRPSSSTAYYEDRLAELGYLRANTTHQSSEWIDAVLQEYRRYQEAMRTNGQLKALLDKQMRMIRASELAFGVFTKEECSLVSNSQRTMQALNQASDELQVMAPLDSRLKQLELDVGNVVDRTGLNSSSSRLVRNADRHSSVVFESSSCASVHCSVEYADLLLLNRFSHLVEKNKASLMDREPIDAQMTRTLQLHHDQKRYQLHSNTRMRKIRLDDRVVYVRSALLSIPSKGLTFVEDSMFIVLSKSPDSDTTAEPRSLVFSLHRVHAASHDLSTFSGSDHASDRIKETIIHLSGRRIERHLRKFKALLSEETSAFV